jgi:hypothetical protein
MAVIDTADAADAADDDLDPPEPGSDVQIGDVTFQLRPRGVGPATLAHSAIRCADLLGRCVQLDHMGAEYSRDGDELTVRAPDGCGVRVTPLREPRRMEG